MRIALTGKLRSGKSLVADILYSLVNSYDEADGEVYSFGSSLKEYADKLFVGSEVYKTEEGKKNRKLYQDFGQKMRELDPDIWVNYLDRSVKDAGLPNVIINDLRQPNEYKWARENGFTVIKVSADEDVRLGRALDKDSFDEQDLTHETEQYVDTFEVDYEIDNTHHYVHQLEEEVYWLYELLRDKERVDES